MQHLLCNVTRSLGQKNISMRVRRSQTRVGGMCLFPRGRGGDVQNLHGTIGNGPCIPVIKVNVTFYLLNASPNFKLHLNATQHHFKSLASNQTQIRLVEPSQSTSGSASEIRFRGERPEFPRPDGRLRCLSTPSRTDPTPYYPTPTVHNLSVAKSSKIFCLGRSKLN